MKPDFLAGRSSPIGATLEGTGVNFSLLSRSASRVELLFFDRVDDARPSRCLDLDPQTHRTYHYWHVFVPGVKAGQLYGYRVYGKFDPTKGQRFDSEKVLLDPYGRGVAVPPAYSRAAAAQPGDNAATAMKSVVADPAAYDWEGDKPLRHHSSQTIIYEAHVRGFTRHPSSGVDGTKRGTYAGMIEKIPYLQELPSNCCRCFSSTPSRRRQVISITGATILCLSSRRTRPTARARTRSGRSMSSATW